MDRTNNFPSFETACPGLYSSPLDLINQPCQLDASERQPVYQGMSVQMLDSPFPTYVNQSDADQNNVYSVNPLNEYNIESLISFTPENYLGAGINVLPPSVLDELVPYDSDNELVIDTLPLTPSIPIFQQLLGNELAIRTPTPVNYSNSGYQLTNPSAEPPNRQDLRQAAAVHPLCMHQTISEDQGTHAEESVNIDTLPLTSSIPIFQQLFVSANEPEERQSVYQGMSVQMLDSPFPTYVSQSDADQNNAYSVNTLNEYNIESLTSFDPENYFGTGINELPPSVIDELVPYNSDNELVIDTLPLTPSIPIFQQLFVSGNEPEIRTPTPVNYSNPGYQLTNPSAEPPNLQDLRPTAVVHPLCMHQTISEDQGTQAEESVNIDTLPLTPSIPIFQQLFVSGNEPEIRTPTPVNYSNPGYQLTNPSAEPPNQQDLRPAAAVHSLCMHQTISEDQGTHAEESENDRSSLVERQRERKREYLRERRKDPVYVERERVRKRERLKDPVYVECERVRKRECLRERRKDPIYVECEREYQREYKRERRKDPVYLECERVRQRERYKDPKDPKDPAYAERKREYKRECRKDPVFAEGKNIYNKIYRRVMKQTFNKEEAARQAKIAKEQYLQSVNSARNLCELPLTSNLVEAPPPPPAFQLSN